MTPLIIVSIYLVILLTLGVCSSRLFRGTSLDYLLASHSIGPFLLLMSLFGTTMTGFSLVGSTNASFAVGVSIFGKMATSSAILHPLCFLMIGLKLWKLGQRHGYTTQIEFFEDRLQCKWIGAILFPVIIGLVIPYLLIGILSAGSVINGVSQNMFAGMPDGIPSHYGSAVICVVVLVYVFVGGMRGTAWANAFQTTIFMILGVVTFFVLIKGIGGQSTFGESLVAATNRVAESNPAHLTRENVAHRIYFAYLLIPLSIGMFPHIFQHWLTARDANAFKLPVVLHPIFVLIVWAPCVLIGTWASGLADVPAKSVLAHLVSTNSGEVLAGLLTAGILAAIMSSLDSQFLCLGTMFTRDVMRRRSNEGDDRKTILIARTFVVGIVAVAFVISLFVPKNIFNIGIWCFSGFSALFPVVVAALYWRRLTCAGVVASVVTTGGLWCYLFQASDFGANKGFEFLGQHPIVSLCAASTLVLVGVSLTTPPPDDETLAKFFEVS
jgi:solute:Na+ symporter, SSS family